MDKLILNARPEGYAIYQIKGTMTVSELRDFLKDYDDETPVYLSFDNGYTYGGIIESNFELEENHDEED